MSILVKPVLWRVAVLSLPVVAAMVPVPALGAPGTNCGDTLTRDTVLARDLTDCAGDGLIIGADNITLDLNSHTIAGTGSGAGIHNNDHDGVEIKDGVLRGFTTGILLEQDSRDNHIQDITTRGNGSDGIELDHAGQPH